MNHFIFILHVAFIFTVISTTNGLHLNDDIISTIQMNQQELKKIIRKRFKNMEDETSSIKIDLMEIKKSIQILSEKVDQISENSDLETIQIISTKTQIPEVPEVSNLVMLTNNPKINIWSNNNEEFQSKIFNGGENINLHCKVENVHNASGRDITWFKNNEIVFDTHSLTGNHKIMVSNFSNEVQSFLHLINASQGDSGSYYCELNGVMSTKVDIIVIDTNAEVKKISDEIFGISSLMKKINDSVIDGQQQFLDMLKTFNYVKNSSPDSYSEIFSNSSQIYLDEVESERDCTSDCNQLLGRKETEKSTRENLKEEINLDIAIPTELVQTEFSNTIAMPKCNTTYIDSMEIKVQELINNQTFLETIVHKYSRKIEEMQKHLIEEKKHYCHQPFVWLDDAQLCLYFSISTLNWDAARLACKSLDSRSDLAVIPDPYRVRSYMMASKLYNYFYFIGGTDRGFPRSFHWINGNPVTSGWDTYEPHNNVPGNNCLWIYKYGYIGDVAHDLGCDVDHYRFICQK